MKSINEFDALLSKRSTSIHFCEYLKKQIFAIKLVSFSMTVDVKNEP